jgi:shikimate dehydrogenase
MIDNKTQLNMIIGYPLEHTQSPLLHNIVYQILGWNAVMLAQPTHHLRSMMLAIKALSVGLVAVTMPFKEEILPYLDEISPEVENLKAANTVICRDGKLWGYNTDIHGIQFALRDQVISHKNILIIGAGGAARAAAYFLRKNQGNLFWLNRTYLHALSMAKEFGGTMINSDIHHLPIDIIVNATPLGMFPHLNSSPLSNYQFQANQVVFDMVYNPIETLLIKRAQLQGAKCISGLDMFIGQGLRQIELLLNTSISLSEIVDRIKTRLKQSIQQSQIYI